MYKICKQRHNKTRHNELVPFEVSGQSRKPNTPIWQFETITLTVNVITDISIDLAAKVKKDRIPV